MARERKSATGSEAKPPEEPHLEVGGDARQLDALPDPLDFRDLMYVPTLVEVPSERLLDQYLARTDVPVLDQGREGACTGFALASVTHYLLRTRGVTETLRTFGGVEVSPRMFYEMARRYDEWAGEDYSGSSARGAMKGWHRHGVCGRAEWPDEDAKGTLSQQRADDARGRPLGAYFRVNHRDIVAMHCAITEVGILYATSAIHSGWREVGAKGAVPFRETPLGGHAFAIVAYDRDGLWIQNSWGDGWGLGGFGRISYDDWLSNGSDVWVARLGVPVTLANADAVAVARSHVAADAESYSYADIRPHIVSIGNDGRLRDIGRFGTSAAEVREIITRDLPAAMAGWDARGGRKRVLLYAHGGLVSEEAGVQRVADFRRTMLDGKVYPLAFAWRSDLWTTVGNILDDVSRRRRPEGILDAAKDFVLDRLDDALEPVARTLGGKALWSEMKENATLAGDRADGGARIVAEHLVALEAADPAIEIHLAGHSAGAILLGPLVQLLTRPPAEGGLQGPIASITLWAPACTVAFFLERYVPAIEAGRVGRTALFVLTDEAERDDNCKRVYNKSLLYLVSNAFEDTPRIPIVRTDGTPILGMDHFLSADPTIKALKAAKRLDVVRAPNLSAQGSRDASRASSHAGFDNDGATLRATLARITGTTSAPSGFAINRSAGTFQDRRRDLTTAQTGSSMAV